LKGKGLQVKRKRYPRKFQQTAVEGMKNSDNIGDLARELGVSRRCLYKWRAKLDRVEPGRKRTGRARTNRHTVSKSTS
jgi:transposase-like protein